MAKMSRDEIDKAIKAQAPGFELAPEQPEHDDFVVQADAKAADRQALAQKYTKKKARAADDAEPQPLEDDTIIVPIEGETAEGKKVRKTAVISSKTGDVTAIQG
jgi:hypothetical protein